LRINHLGEISYSKKGTPMKIIRYVNTSDLTIEFQDEYKVRRETTYGNFNKGQVKNPYDRTVCEVGYIGEGKYTTGGKDYRTKQYAVWEDMMYRCYKEKDRHLHPAYENCTVCEEWHNYQTFGKWYDENFYTVKDSRTHLDKDILFKDNKLYSPTTCVFVPQRINMVFMKKNRTVDSDLPNGIHRCVTGFSAQYINKSLGVYKTLDEALLYYNIEKQLHISKLANEYKNIIPPELYNALINWNKQLVA